MSTAEAIFVSVVPNSMQPMTNSTVPRIKFAMKITMPENYVLINLNGFVSTDDEKIIAPIIVRSMSPQNGFIQLPGITDTSATRTTKFDLEIMFALDKASLDYIEERRMKNAKHDVTIGISWSVKALIFNLRLGDYQLRNIGGIEVIGTSLNNPNRANNNLNILTAGNEQRRHLEFATIDQNTSYTIASSHWTLDYQKHLGIGNFILVEVPVFGLDFDPKIQLNDEQKRFKERLEKAHETLQAMHEELKKGEWGNVVFKLRDIELFKNNVTQFIRSMIHETTGMDDEKVGELILAINKLKSYASELHHVVDSEGKVKATYTGGKEDAYLAYMLTASLVNLLAKKFAMRIGRNT